MSDGIEGLLREIQAENKSDHQEIKAEFRALNGRVRQNEVEIARIRERQNVMTALSSVIGVVASAIAAWLGVRS
jgi:hypothetical protein